MSKYKIKELFPAILLVCVLLYTFIVIATSNILLQPKHFAAALCTVLVLATYFKRRKYYRKVLAVTLMLGTFNLLAFTPSITIVTLGVDAKGVSFQPFSFLIALIFFFLNIKRVIALLGLETNREAENGVVYLDEEKFESFKEKYSNRSIDELNTIISGGTYVIEAVEAAKLLIAEKATADKVIGAKV